MKFLIFVTILFIHTNAEMARFDNYRVYSVVIKNQEQYDVMKYLEDNSDAYNFWDSPGINIQIEIVVPPHKFSDFEELMLKFKMQYNISIDNMQRLIDDERALLNKPRPKNADAIDWENYYSTDEIYQWMDELKSRYSDYLNITTIGHSYEGREIKMITLSKRANNRAIVLESTIHAREWISPATSTWVLNELLTSTSSDTMDIAENIDWHFIPVTNPDGYEYTRNSNRNWRKTRSPVSTLCFGVDLNRNFAFNWLQADETGNEGGSRVPCTDTYSGATPYSEVEAQAIEEFLKVYAHKIDAYLALHSYGHLFLHPWGHTRIPAEAVNELGAVGRAGAEAILATNGIQYTVGSSNQVLYASTGTSRDHTHGEHKIPITFTVEMRGNGPYGNYGFVLPASHIKPNAEEVFAGITALIKRAREFGRFPRV